MEKRKERRKDLRGVHSTRCESTVLGNIACTPEFHDCRECLSWPVVILSAPGATNRWTNQQVVRFGLDKWGRICRKVANLTERWEHDCWTSTNSNEKDNNLRSLIRWKYLQRSAARSLRSARIRRRWTDGAATWIRWQDLSRCWMASRITGKG